MDGSDRCAAHLALVGRKTTLTPALTEQIVAILRAGNYVNVACRATGVPSRTFHDWMGRGRSTKAVDAPYREFRERIEQARATGEVRNVAIIAGAATTNWQAAAWLLERSTPERWARPSQREKPAEQPRDEAISEPGDPFAEVDQLAARRQRAS